MSKPPSLDQLMTNIETEVMNKVHSLLDKSISLLSFPSKELALKIIKDTVYSAIDYVLKSSPEHVFFYIIDVMFAPNLVLRQVLLIISLQFAMLGWNELYRLAIKFYAKFTIKGRKKDYLERLLENAKTYEEWISIAQELDKLYGFDKWRKEEYCPFIDYISVMKRTKETQDMMKKGDVFNLMFRLRGGLSRTQFGLQHEGLYTRAYAGTKHVVEKYNETVCAALNLIADTLPEVDNIPSDAKLAFFNETRHAFGRTALMLSGGAFLGFYHIGVCTTLHKYNLLPRVISGASAGAIIAGLVGVKTDEEMDMVSTYDYISTHAYHFFKFSDHICNPTGRWLQYFVPSYLKPIANPILALLFDGKLLNLDTEHFKRNIMDICGLWTFQEAFDRTGRIINIMVAPPNDYDPPRLLNYLTAPHVCIWSAVCASCALPGIFDSFQLIVKEPSGNYSQENLWTRQIHGNATDAEIQKTQGYTDGSMDCDLPMKQLSELFNVSHFIISQTNPHAALLSSLSLTTTVWSNPFYGGVVAYIQFLLNQFRDFIKNVTTLLVSRSLSPTWGTKRGLFNIISQDYEGRSEDIMVFPWRSHLSVIPAILRIFKNPTVQELFDLHQAGERETWHLFSKIQANCQIELTLDRCVQRLRKRVSDENDEFDTLPELPVSQKIPSTTTTAKKPDRKRDSFYTSRSIVNLSGLSVSDPLPKSQGANIRSFDEDLLNLAVSGDDVPLTDRSQPFQNSNGIPLSKNLASLSDSDVDNTPRPYGLPLTSRTGSRTSSYSNIGMTLSPSNDRFETSSRTDKSESSNGRGTRKTTSMAKFYYRDSSNAPSNESLRRLEK